MSVHRPSTVVLVTRAIHGYWDREYVLCVYRHSTDILVTGPSTDTGTKDGWGYVLSVPRQSTDVLVTGLSTDTGTGDGWGYVLSVHRQSYLLGHPWMRLEVLSMDMCTQCGNVYGIVNHI